MSSEYLKKVAIDLAALRAQCDELETKIISLPSPEGFEELQNEWVSLSKRTDAKAKQFWTLKERLPATVGNVDIGLSKEELEKLLKEQDLKITAIFGAFDADKKLMQTLELEEEAKKQENRSREEERTRRDQEKIREEARRREEEARTRADEMRRSEEEARRKGEEAKTRADEMRRRAEEMTRREEETRRREEEARRKEKEEESVRIAKEEEERSKIEEERKRIEEELRRRQADKQRMDEEARRRDALVAQRIDRSLRTSQRPKHLVARHDLADLTGASPALERVRRLARAGAAHEIR